MHKFDLSDVPMGELLAELYARSMKDLARELGPALALGAHVDKRWGLVDQSDSPLGRNAHCAAVRRRMSTGAAGATKVGGRYLLTADALNEELFRKAPARDDQLREAVDETNETPSSELESNDVETVVRAKLRMVRA